MLIQVILKLLMQMIEVLLFHLSMVVEHIYKIRAVLELGNISVIYAGKSNHNRCMFGICITENMYLDISVIDDGTIGVEHLKKGIV